MTDVFMITADSEKLGRICKAVWRDRAGILADGGALSGESVLLRAVYWRLCKEGNEPDRHLADAPLFQELVRQYRDETG
jgi:hypothetical protein